MRAWR